MKSAIKTILEMIEENIISETSTLLQVEDAINDRFENGDRDYTNQELIDAFRDITE